MRGKRKQRDLLSHSPVKSLERDTQGGPKQTTGTNLEGRYSLIGAPKSPFLLCS